MATRPTCSECLYFHPPIDEDSKGWCHYAPAEVAVSESGRGVEVARPPAAEDDVACHLFKPAGGTN